MQGWVKVFREIQEQPWFGDPIVKAVYLHLMLNCNARDGYRVFFKGSFKTLGAGQYWTTIRRLALEVKISIQSVRTALKKLQLTQVITQDHSAQGTIIKINNWGDYQGSTQELSHDSQSRNKAATLEQEEIREKRERKIYRLDLFDQVWKVYPVKRGKGAAIRIWNMIKPDETLVNKMLAAISRSQQTESWMKGIIPNPAKWLDEERWEDDSGNPEFNLKTLKREAFGQTVRKD